MQVYPDMNIRFPAGKEKELVAAMRALCGALWQWQDKDTHGKPVESGSLYFHRDATTGHVPCTLCICRRDANLFVVVNIVPDKMGDHISKSQYVELLREFDERIACPATEGVGGMTSIDAETETLADHFSSEELRLLKLFCSSSNASDLGSHPSDQEKWMAFLIAVHRNGKNVHCDTFRACLRSERCWPEHGIDRLVSEYDFAMQLLRQNKMAL